MSYCKMTVLGRLTNDPKTKDFEKGSVTRFGVAYYSGFGEKRKTHFVDCETWGKLGTTIGTHLKKGDSVLLEGFLEQQKWEKDGEKSQKHVLKVDDFRFCDSKEKSESSDSETEDSDTAPF